MIKKLLFLFSLFFFSLNLMGQVWAPPGVHLRPSSDVFTYDIGINKYDGDTYLYFAPGLNMNFTSWGFSMQLPLNILVHDALPKQPDSKVGKIRSIDYDSRSDYQRVLNYFWFGNYGVYKPNEITYSLYIGKMFDGYIGHGTIINRYVNNQRLDVYKLGVMADINTDYGGVQVFTNSIYDRDVNAGRGYIRPFGILGGLFGLVSGKRNVAMLAGNVLDDVGRKKVNDEITSTKEEERYVEIETDPVTGEKKEVEKVAPKNERKFAKEEAGDTSSGRQFFDLRRFALGYTSAYDARAPVALDLDTTGNLRFDETNNAKVKSSRRQSIEGFDAEFKIISTALFEVTPYGDYNRIKNIPNAMGRHYGVIIKVGGKDINLTIRPEYRSMTSNYIPMYFDSFYEIERFQVNLESSFPYTKYEYLHNKPVDGPAVKGQFHTIILNIYRIGFEANYENYTGNNNSRVFVGAYIPIGSILRFSAYYMKKGFDKSGEAFKVDDRSQGAAELALNLGPVTIRGMNVRRWVLDSNTNQFKAKDEQMVFFSGGKAF